MTIDEIHAAVQAIRDLANNPERAHAAEDRLYLAVLQAIAESESDDAAGLKLMAMAALKADEIKFDRWYS